MIALHENWTDQARWDDFVAGHAQARFSDWWRYGQVVDCYGYEPANLCFTEGPRIVAVLPAVRARSLVFGRRLISQPFSEYGGLLLDDGLSDEQAHAVFDLLKRFLARGRRGGTIEIHGNHGVRPALREPMFTATSPHHIAFLDTRRPADEIWKNELNQGARKSVNKARKAGLVVTEDHSPQAIERDFFALYLQSMKRLGVPPHRIGYYLNCERLLGAHLRILWAELDGKRVAALLGFACGKRVSIINTVSDPAYWSLCPNDLLHWEFVSRTAAEGYDFFDFGSVRYGGQEEFKRKWGCQLAEHKRYFLCGQTAAASAKTFDTSGPVMSSFSTLWARYMPQAVCTRLGPVIRGQLMR